MICRLLVASAFSLSCACSLAQAEGTAQKPGLSQLAAQSDLVAVAQVVATQYEYTRGFPSKGFATLRILIPYKSPLPLDQVRVFEQGIKERECYFPEISPWREGERFLVFLEHLEVDRFKGNPDSCALPILVTDSNHYALRIPQDAISLGEKGEALVRELVYADPAAYIDSRALTSTTTAKMVEQLKLRQLGDELIYTQGIRLGDVRRLMGSEALAKQ